MAYMSWRPFDLPAKQYYEDADPQAAYRMYLGDMFGSQQSNPLFQYASNFYNLARARYLRASEADPNLMWVDSLDDGSGDDDLNDLIRREFYAQPAGARGETLWYKPAGRMTSESF